jgi:hypothetical protein
MKALHSRILLGLACCASLAAACSQQDDGSPDDTNGSGGTINGGGGTQGGVLDRDALAENCNGLEVAEAKGCTEAELVCSTDAGALCICGGVPPETGQARDDDGRNEDDWRGPRSGSGGRSNSPSPRDLVWVCYSIGPTPMEGEGGEGGATHQGGEGGAL